MELPVSFADYTRALLGDEDYKELVTSLESEQSVSIRLNPLKPFAFRSGEHAVPWCTSGFYLEDARHLLLIPCSMRAVIMYRKLRPCLLSRL